MIDYNTLGRQGPPTGEMGLPPQLGKILEETLTSVMGNCSE